jgi:hypothetical protein
MQIRSVKLRKILSSEDELSPLNTFVFQHGIGIKTEMKTNKTE